VKVIVQKHLANLGLCSRREGERLVLAGKVQINGVRARIGIFVDASKDVVTIDGQKDAAPKQTVAVFKPRGIVCSKNSEEGKTIFDQLPQYAGLNTVGRLDKESEGLLLLSDDGRVTKAVTGSDHRTEKEYIVEVREELFPGIMQRMEKGIKIEGSKTLPCIAKMRDNRTSFNIILKEGRKHQIRRMCDACHLTVLSLKRIRVGVITLGKLRPGQARALSGAEISSLIS
jgi:23S rRNA pseudouridine2604 synthase